MVYGEDSPDILSFLSLECMEECGYAWRYRDRCGGQDALIMFYLNTCLFSLV